MTPRFPRLHSSTTTQSMAGALPGVRTPSILAGERLGTGSGTGLATDAEGTRRNLGAAGSTSTRPRERSLVVLDGADPSSTLRAALEHIDLEHGTVHLLLVYPTAEYEARRRDRLEAGLTAPYSIGQLEEEARLVAQRVGYDWVRSHDDEFDAIGAVGRLTDCVLRVVEANGTTVVYLAPTERSRWQRLFGGGDEVASLRRRLPAAVRIVPLDRGGTGPLVGVPGPTVPVDIDGQDATAVDMEIPLGK